MPLNLQPGLALALLNSRTRFSKVTENRSWTSRQRTGCHQSIQTANIVEAGGLMSYAAERRRVLCRVQRPTWTKS